MKSSPSQMRLNQNSSMEERKDEFTPEKEITREGVTEEDEPIETNK